MLCELKTNNAVLERLRRLPTKLEELYFKILKKMRCYKVDAD